MCGIFACILREGCEGLLDVAHLVRDGLIQLQHRGQESAGIVGTTGSKAEHFVIAKGNGLVGTVFPADSLTQFNKCVAAVGHTRYATMGIKDAINCVQPFVMYTSNGLLAVAHNGELINNKELRRKMLKQGWALTTDTDSEMIALIMGSAKPNESDWPSQIQHFMEASELSYSLAFLAGSENCLYAVRDPRGNRPLCIAELRPAHTGVNGVSHIEPLGWIVTSESCALSSVGATYLRDVLPGEILAISSRGIQADRSRIYKIPAKFAFCIFEYVYFSSPASVLEGQQVYSVRYRIGQRLAIEAPAVADIVSNVPDTSGPAARGYAKQMNLEYIEVLIKNSYVGRTFIQPSAKSRVSAVTLKFQPLAENFRGKRVVLVDDSIVRGNTMKQMVKLLKDHGAKEVHVRLGAPPIQHPCYMGINIPTREELIANCIPDIRHYRDRKGLDDYNSKDLAVEFNADSVVYLSVEGLRETVKNGVAGRHYCDACLTEEYPVAPPSDIEDLGNR